MDEDTPEPEPEKPRFLLPDGCKDLVDALRLQQQADEAASQLKARAAASKPLQPLTKSVALPDPVKVLDLASALHLKPFEVIGYLIKLKVFVSLSSQLEFSTASVVCAKFGVAAIKVS